MDERYIVIEKNVRVVIDRNLLRKLSDDEEVERRIVGLLDTRISSLTHRLSSWLSETIASVILELSTCSSGESETKHKEEDLDKEITSSQSLGQNQKKRRRGSLVGVFKLIGNGIKLSYVGKSIKQRKLLSYKGKLYRIELDYHGFIKPSSEAYPIVLSLVRKCGEVRLYWGGRTRSNKVILRVDPDVCD